MQKLMLYTCLSILLPSLFLIETQARLVPYKELASTCYLFVRSETQTSCPIQAFSVELVVDCIISDYRCMQNLASKPGCNDERIAISFTKCIDMVKRGTRE